MCVCRSDFRQIPNHQEVWADADSDQSLIIELNSLDEDVPDEMAAASGNMHGSGSEQGRCNAAMEHRDEDHADVPSLSSLFLSVALRPFCQVIT